MCLVVRCSVCSFFCVCRLLFVLWLVLFCVVDGVVAGSFYFVVLIYVCVCWVYLLCFVVAFGLVAMFVLVAVVLVV